MKPVEQLHRFVAVIDMPQVNFTGLGESVADVNNVAPCRPRQKSRGICSLVQILTLDAVCTTVPRKKTALNPNPPGIGVKLS